MRTLLLILLVSTGMSLTAISPAMAGGGGDGAGATNGKTPSRARFVIDNNDDAVSYTHLTLPTILLV